MAHLVDDVLSRLRHAVTTESNDCDALPGARRQRHYDRVNAMLDGCEEIERLRAALKSLIPEHIAGPFICGGSHEERDGLPDRLHVCPSYGADWVAIYQRVD
jgi:hypothetical protein